MANVNTTGNLTNSGQAHLSNSMRDNYGIHGVDEYYKMVGASYRNPHYMVLKKVIFEFLDRYMETQENVSELRILDLAAGSGEATEAVRLWREARWPMDAPTAAHVPHRRMKVFKDKYPRPELNVTATDPYTKKAYETRIPDATCLPLSFQDIANGELDGRMFDVTIVSFALHLAEPGQLWNILSSLSTLSTWFAVIAPTKKPEIKNYYADWMRVDPVSFSAIDESKKIALTAMNGDGYEIVIEKVRLRLFRSCLL